MSIEIEIRGVRWRSVSRSLRVETASDRRMQVARTCLLAGQTLRPVLPNRADQPSRADEKRQASGRAAANLRTQIPVEVNTPEVGMPPEVKD